MKRCGLTIKKEVKKYLLEKFDETYDVSNFTKRLRRILDKYNIKQTDLAKAMKIDNQTISNWLNSEKTPKWIDYMYRMNRYFYMRVEDYSPLYLFYSDYNQYKESTKYLIQDVEFAYRLCKAEYEKFYMFFNQFNNIIEKGTISNDIDFTILFQTIEFYKVIQDINENFCKLPENKRYLYSGDKSYNKLKDTLFNVVCDFLAKSNEQAKTKKKTALPIPEHLLEYMLKRSYKNRPKP